MSATRKRRLPPIHARALNILKAYGANAHLYLPGVGAINGITAGNWIDSAGTTPGVVDSPIGLIQDSIGGIHASQATTAAKPILRLNSGIYSAQFDGVDDYLSLGENTGTFGAIIAGAKPSSSGWFMVCGSGAQLPTNTGVRLGISGAAMSWMFETANGASAIQSQSPFAPVFSAPTVVGGRWTPTEQSLRINGISYGVTSSQVSASTQGFAIGAGRYASGSTGDFFPGHIYPVIVIKGTVSDADLLTLEKFVGSLSGVVV